MHGFDKDDETILHAITDHAGAQLENMDLCRRAAENRTVGWSLVKSLDVFTVLYVLKREALLLCGGERCNVYLADAEGELYMLDPSNPSWHIAHSNESVAAAAVRGCDTINIKDVYAEQRFGSYAQRQHRIDVNRTTTNPTQTTATTAGAPLNPVHHLEYGETKIAGTAGTAMREAGREAGREAELDVGVDQADQETTHYPWHPRGLSGRLKSILCVPMVGEDGRTVAVIEILNKTRPTADAPLQLLKATSSSASSSSSSSSFNAAFAPFSSTLSSTLSSTTSQQSSSRRGRGGGGGGGGGGSGRGGRGGRGPGSTAADKASKTFTRQDEFLVKQLADTATVALVNALNHVELSGRKDRLERLVDAGMSLGSELETEQLLTSILDG